MKINVFFKKYYITTPIYNDGTIFKKESLSISIKLRERKKETRKKVVKF